MKNTQICFLCEGPAKILSETDRGNRLVIGCSGECPTYEISKRAITEVQEKPVRKLDVIEKIKAFHNENAEDMPVIRMTKDSQDYYVTTRSRETSDSC